MGYRVAIVVATGEVGRTFLKVLEERNFPVDDLVLYASERSEGKILTFRGKEYEVKAIGKESSFIGSVMIEENVISSTDFKVSIPKVEDMVRAIKDAGFIPAQRDTYYRIVRRFG